MALSSSHSPSSSSRSGDGFVTTAVQGRVIGERYRLIRRLAAGGMANVYEAVDERTERVRAVKLLQPSLVTSEAHRRRFTREATVTARVASDHVVDVLDAGIDASSGSPFLVMPLLLGRDLAAEIEARGALDAPTVVSYLTQIARALDRAHQARIVHRDLKPANVFLAERDDGSRQILVLDFGIAKLIDRVSTRATESILGSPLYLAPEQVRYKKERVTERADIYALGQLAYTALVGEAYYAPEDEASDGVMGLLMEMAVGETQPASERARTRRSIELPPSFDAWFARATAREPSARFDSASQAVVALAGVFDLPVPEFRTAFSARVNLDDGDASPMPELEPELEPVRQRSRDVRRIGLAVAMLALVGGGAAFWATRARSVESAALPAASESATGPARATAQPSASVPVVVPQEPTSTAAPVTAVSSSPPAASVEPTGTASAAPVIAKKGPAPSAHPSSAPTAPVVPSSNSGGYRPPVTER